MNVIENKTIIFRDKNHQIDTKFEQKHRGETSMKTELQLKINLKD